jgi:hypothetical protein
MVLIHTVECEMIDMRSWSTSQAVDQLVLTSLKACGSDVHSAPVLPPPSSPFNRNDPWKFHRRVWSGVLPDMKLFLVGLHTACWT